MLERTDAATVILLFPHTARGAMPFITQLLLPKRDNRNRPFAREHYRAFHARLLRCFGGWTRKGQAEGAWLGSSGEIFTDEHWIYEVGHGRRDLRFWP